MTQVHSADTFLCSSILSIYTEKQMLSKSKHTRITCSSDIITLCIKQVVSLFIIRNISVCVFVHVRRRCVCSKCGTYPGRAPQLCSSRSVSLKVSQQPKKKNQIIDGQIIVEEHSYGSK